VTPLGVLFGRSNYLVALEGKGGKPRSWRLDQMSDLKVLDKPASPPEDFSLQAFADESFGIYHDEIQDVILLIEAELPEDALRWRFHATQQVKQEEDGSVLVTFRAGGMRELSWHLFTWGDKIEIIAPQVLKDMMVAELREAGRAHGAWPKDVV